MKIPELIFEKLDTAIEFFRKNCDYKIRCDIQPEYIAIMIKSRLITNTLLTTLNDTIALQYNLNLNTINKIKNEYRLLYTKQYF